VRLAFVIALVACKGGELKNLDLEKIVISGDARLRTDIVGGGQHTSTSAFVLVDARNTAEEGAYVSLGGELVDAGGTAIGTLKPQSLWVPAGESRTFALVDTERKPRPAATSTRIKVRGALTSDPAPRARIADFHTFDDHGKVVVQANLVNDYPRIGHVMVIASFHDAQNRPLTRPFRLVRIGPQGTTDTVEECPEAESPREKFPARAARCPVQFVGPQGSVRGALYVGDVVY
jgi:hypothetical protein